MIITSSSRSPTASRYAATGRRPSLMSQALLGNILITLYIFLQHDSAIVCDKALPAAGNLSDMSPQSLDPAVRKKLSAVLFQSRLVDRE